MKTNDRLVIVSGASKGIGKSYLTHYLQQPGTNVIGISRTQEGLANLDLLDERATACAVSRISLEGIERVVYIHSIGVDKFEPDGLPEIDADGDGIDDDVYRSNVRTFESIARPLIERTGAAGIKLLLCNIGSVSDIYDIPYWRSFSRAKNLVRRFLRADNNTHVRGACFNVSSLIADGETYGRRFADTTYWLTPEQLLESSTPFIDDPRTERIKYAELDIVNPSPEFTPDYFLDLRMLYARWQRDLGFEGRPVPHGIRI